MQELPSPWRAAVRDAPGALTVAAPSAGDIPMATNESSVLAVLAADEARHIEDVIARCGLTPGRVSATLLSLELAGRARQLEGQRWIAVDERSRRH